jgi:hypothetical protein
MTSAPELIRAVKAAGGRFLIDGDRLGIVPKEAGEPIVEELRARKREIIALVIGGSTYSGQSQNEDTGPWQDDFRRWLAAKCVSRPDGEDCTSVSALWVDFCEQQVKRDSVPCLRDVFELLLARAGFLIRDGLASRLLLKADREAHLNFKSFTASALAADANKCQHLTSGKQQISEGRYRRDASRVRKK